MFKLSDISSLGSLIFSLDVLNGVRASVAVTTGSYVVSPTRSADSQGVNIFGCEDF